MSIVWDLFIFKSYLLFISNLDVVVFYLVNFKIGIVIIFVYEIIIVCEEVFIGRKVRVDERIWRGLER